MFRQFVFVLALAACFPALASSSTKKVPQYKQVTPTQSTTIYADRPTLDLGVWEPRPNGAVAVKDTSTVTVPSGSKATVTATRTISNATIRNAAKSIARNLIPGANIAITVYDILRPQGVEPGQDGGWVIDPGQPKSDNGGYMQDFRTGQPMRPSAIAGREAATAVKNGTLCGTGDNASNCFTVTITSTNGYCNNGACTWSYTGKRYNNGNYQGELGGSETRPEIVTSSCRETTSMLMVRGTLLCPSETRVQPSDEIVDDIIDDLPASDLRDLVKEWAKGIPAGLPTEGNAPDLSGPPHVDDQPTVITKPDGTTESTSRRWDMDYPGGGNITHTPRIVVTNPEGTTTIEGPGAQPGGSSEGPTDCDKYPDSIGCSEYGTPDDEQLQKRTENVSFNPVDLAGGSCPAPRTFQAFGKSYSISWEPICDATVDYVRPTVLLIFGAMAVFVFIGGFKS